MTRGHSILEHFSSGLQLVHFPRLAKITLPVKFHISRRSMCSFHSYVHKFGRRLRIAFLPIPEYLLHFSASWTVWGWIRGNSEVDIASLMAKSPILVEWIPQHMGPQKGPQNEQIHKFSSVSISLVGGFKHCLYSIIMGCHPSHWLVFFPRGRYTTNQFCFFG